MKSAEALQKIFMADTINTYLFSCFRYIHFLSTIPPLFTAVDQYHQLNSDISYGVVVPFFLIVLICRCILSFILLQNENSCLSLFSISPREYSLSGVSPNKVIAELPNNFSVFESIIAKSEPVQYRSTPSVFCLHWHIIIMFPIEACY